VKALKEAAATIAAPSASAITGLAQKGELSRFLIRPGGVSCGHLMPASRGALGRGGE
jgi:hypothetical protein